MKNKITTDQRTQLEEKGYFICRGLVAPKEVNILREQIVGFVENPGEREEALDKELAVRQGEGEDLDRRARFRKIQRLGRHVPEIWNNHYAAAQVLDVVSEFLNTEDVFLKFDSVFLKPAKTGGSTPWHQDIGLWRDDHVGACNAWLAIDPATKENGCMQFVPGSHKAGLVEHVKYDDGVHPELPREMCADLEIEQIEMQPGDVVFWHSWIWHYSPPNTSDHDRIGMGAVWVDWDMVVRSGRHRKYFVVMKNGEANKWPPIEVQAPDTTEALGDS